MDSRRRHLLRAVGSAGLAAVAGCAGSGSSTTETAKLLPVSGDAMDMMGEAVALSADGTTALVGAPG